jgi:hypothetical protein
MTQLLAEPFTFQPRTLTSLVPRTFLRAGISHHSDAMVSPSPAPACGCHFVAACLKPLAGWAGPAPSLGENPFSLLGPGFGAAKMVDMVAIFAGPHFAFDGNYICANWTLISTIFQCEL